MATKLNQRGICRTLCWSVVILTAFLTAVALLVLAQEMAPMKPGSPEVFWKVACGVSLRPGIERFGDAYFVDDEWVAYDIAHMHGSDICYVPTADVLAHFDAVIEALQEAHGRDEDTDFVRGYAKWIADERPRNLQRLLKWIEEAQRESMAAEDINLLAHSVAEEEAFWERWHRADWYWGNFAFEWTFLSGLSLFALWPGIRGGSPIRWALHLAPLPTLFLLPAYLGYATLTFTSAGPSGGVVYPYLLSFARHGFMNDFDIALLNRLPQVLEPLSTPIGQPMALTGMGMPGPTSAVAAGLLLGTSAFLLAHGCRRWASR